MPGLRPVLPGKSEIRTPGPYLSTGNAGPAVEPGTAGYSADAKWREGRRVVVMKDHTVAVLGASENPERYSHQAVLLLQAHGYRVLPVHPALREIAGLPVVASVAALPPVDTLTLYIGAARLPAMAPEIVQAGPGRVIFNPGTESPELQAALDAAGIPWQEACTLVLLRTGQFEV